MANNPRAKDNLTAPRFQPGQTGNPGGKTSAQRQLEIANAEAATRLRARLLGALESQLTARDDESPEDADKVALELIKTDVLRLLKDSEDRGLGSPKSNVDVTSSDGSMSPTRIEVVPVDKLAEEDDPLGFDTDDQRPN